MKFKVGEKVIGKQWPYLIEATIIEVVARNRDAEYYLIEFYDNDRKQTAIMPDYRLRPIQPPDCTQLNMFQT